MKIKQYQIDAFASRTFEGNPAAVCPLDHWLDDAVMQAIAEENNLSETAFFVATKRGFHLRWFTPIAEVKLCGHATLAAAHVLFNILDYRQPAITFETLSGDLIVKRNNAWLAMDFPAQPATPCPAPDALIAGLGKRPLEVLSADDYVAVFNSEDEVLALAPDFSQLQQLDLRGVTATAPGRQVDFVSRFFAPKYGINEDPVTGSAHCILAPYWAGRLGKQTLTARQVSKRGGNVQCALQGDRVVLSGTAVTFMTAELNIECPE